MVGKEDPNLPSSSSHAALYTEPADSGCQLICKVFTGTGRGSRDSGLLTIPTISAGLGRPLPSGQSRVPIAHVRSPRKASPGMTPSGGHRPLTHWQDNRTCWISLGRISASYSPKAQSSLWATPSRGPTVGCLPAAALSLLPGSSRARGAPHPHPGQRLGLPRSRVLTLGIFFNSHL